MSFNKDLIADLIVKTINLLVKFFKNSNFKNIKSKNVSLQNL